MPIERVYINPDSPVIKAECECGHSWYPYEGRHGSSAPSLPFEAVLTCPSCKMESVQFFADDKMKREILHQKYVLGLPKKLENAKKKIEALEKERDDWKNKHEKLLENNTKLSNAIDKLATKLEQFGAEIDENDKNPLTG
jgi:hypothetical protein